MNKNSNLDLILIGFAMMIGVAEAAHLAAVFLAWPFGSCVKLFAVGMAAVICLLAGLWGIGYMGRRRTGVEKPRGACACSGGKNRQGILLMGVLIVLCTQVGFIVLGPGCPVRSDMMAETVGSFLAEDAVYAVNPLTGREFTEGLPMRIQILGLPSLYGFLCKLTGMSVDVVVRKMVPVLVLLCAYAAYAELGKALFRDGGVKRMGFLLVAALLFWVGAYGESMDGYGLLCRGWTGETIRNTVLLPWLFSLILRKKGILVILCILAEGCITWTLYGAGVGVLVVVGMTVSSVLCGQRRKLRESAGKEEAR